MEKHLKFKDHISAIEPVGISPFPLQMAELVMTEGRYTMIINLPRKLVKDLLEQHIYLDFWFLNLSFSTIYCIECLH